MAFPAELDEYLDRSASVRNFDFAAISQDFIASASGLLRHPFADEPEDMVAARALEVFSAEALKARWESRHGAWSVVAQRDWEVVGSQELLLMPEDPPPQKPSLEKMSDWAHVPEMRERMSTDGEFELVEDEKQRAKCDVRADTGGYDDPVAPLGELSTDLILALGLASESNLVEAGCGGGCKISIAAGDADSGSDSGNSEDEYLSACRLRARLNRFPAHAGI
eukprot:TRINITY_DN9877_c0_g1_i2.p1 TRINITY_DN9877_c0_g1~~TRINITY_DN9877_c0_g1_i2.p1  ORF type:complete len:248 (+),score=57.27 TRINITY_DN9877_c0_g1_i2:76-744(+)